MLFPLSTESPLRSNTEEIQSRRFDGALCGFVESGSGRNVRGEHQSYYCGTSAPVLGFFLLYVSLSGRGEDIVHNGIEFGFREGNRMCPCVQEGDH
jgi:hypothetical protein